LLAKPRFRAVASNLLQTIAPVPLFVALYHHEHPANRVTGKQLGDRHGIRRAPDRQGSMKKKIEKSKRQLRRREKGSKASTSRRADEKKTRIGDPL
jgi:hypothetical protein